MDGCFDCLIGLNFGSEGKGKIAAYLSGEYDVSSRVGSPNSGHTFYIGSKRHINHYIPSAVVSGDLELVIPSGSVLSPESLKNEMNKYSLNPNNLKIDNLCSIVFDEHIEFEKDDPLLRNISSTLQGNGASKIDKIMRRGNLAKNYFDDFLRPFLDDCSQVCISYLQEGKKMLIEGSQGFGLSLNYGYYPYVTSGDCTVSSLISDSGIPLGFHRNTIGVIRTYPIRVGGNSGPTESDEITWEELALRSGSKSSITEFTSVTKKPRRIFNQDYFMLDKAISINQPDILALNFIDYVNAEDYGKKDFVSLSELSKSFVKNLENKIGQKIDLIGTGPFNEHIIDRRKNG